MIAKDKLVGIQISPISIIDEGVDELLDLLQGRFGINAVMVGTVSWLGLKAGRSITHAIDGWPDHGGRAPHALEGGAYFQPRPNYYTGTFIKDFAAADQAMAGIDILDLVVPKAHARGMSVIPDLMEPLFKYAGHGSAAAVKIANMPQCLEVDLLGRYASEPCTSNPDYRSWWHGMVEQQVQTYDIDGIMWCNERNSPLDRTLQGQAPGCFCPHCRKEAAERGIDVERVRIAFREVWDFMRRARAGEAFADGNFVEFLRVLLRNPEILLWERFWLERSKDLDRELYGIVKWCNPDVSFGLNIWNRNHFNPIRKAQWSWREQIDYADWVKPITYQHQAGEIFSKEMSFFANSILRDFSQDEFVPAMARILGLGPVDIGTVVGTGMEPESYVGGQCADAVRGCEGRIPVYMGVGVDAPRSRADLAVCTPDIVYRSVLSTFHAGGKGVIYSPSYASMRHENLDAGTRALRELGVL